MTGTTRKAVYVKITGRVQGVGFRWWTVHEALARGLDGWVRNRSDGSVETLLGGNDRQVEDMVQVLHKGPPGARVDDMRVTSAGDPGPIGFSQEATS